MSKRQSKSCKRCLRRKKRCYGFPICANCERANEPCEQSDFAVQLHQRDDTYAALQRIKTLETQLESARAELAAAREVAESDSLSQSQSPPLLTRSILVDEPISSVLPPLRSLEHIVQTAVLGRLSAPALDFSERAAVTQPRIPLPSNEVGTRLIRSYLDAIHPWYPILQPADLYQLHAQRDRLARTEDEPAIVRLLMVYAIGGALQTLGTGDSNMSISPRPEDYYSSALLGLPALLRLPHLDGIEALVLLLLYHLQLPAPGGSRKKAKTAIWHLVGMAMRMCVDLGLHREGTCAFALDRPGETLVRIKQGGPVRQGRQRRLFWAVFCLDCNISTAFRRPLSLSERDMDVQLPRATDTPSDAVWVSFVRLRHLEARIYADIHSPGVPPELRHRRSSRAAAHLADLDAWARELPSSVAERDRVELRLLWNKAVLALLQPFVGTAKASQEQHHLVLVGRCLDAAGQICEALRHLSQQNQNGYARLFAEAQSVFYAGLVICCCLCISPQLASASAADSLGVCSATMEDIARHVPRFQQHCDVLEEISRSVLESVSRRTASPTEHLAEPDIVAVESLMELSSRQSPPARAAAAREDDCRLPTLWTAAEDGGVAEEEAGSPLSVLRRLHSLGNKDAQSWQMLSDLLERERQPSII